MRARRCLAHFIVGALTFAALILPPASLAAQDAAKKVKKAKSETSETSEKKISIPPLFRSESVIPVTLTANMRQLRGDKADKVVWRAATLSFPGDSGRPVVLPIKVHTHGIWRLKNCRFPPLRLHVSNKTSKGTVFHNAGKPKLVNHCRDTDQYEQYVLQEMQLYRVYQLLTPASHRVRLLRLSYADSASGKVDAVRYAFLLEDPDQLAARLGAEVMKVKGAGPDDFEPGPIALAYLFEYMIGNTDFSFAGLHNTELMGRPDGVTIPVVYDFDFSGAVNATYATVDPALRVRRVRDRLFRGFCSLTPEYRKAIPLFQEKKAAIYALYTDEVGKLMNPSTVRETLEYFDDFYKTIGDARAVDGNILADCIRPR